MDEAELEEVQSAAEGARLTVSAWVRRALREARTVRPAPRAPDAAVVSESLPGWGSKAPARSLMMVDDVLLRTVMERHHFTTRDAAVHFALRRVVDPPMARDEVLAMRGTGWDGDVDSMRSEVPPAGV